MFWGPVNRYGDRIRWKLWLLRTHDPKLAWIEQHLKAADIAYRREEAPYLEARLYVDVADYNNANDITLPVADIPDDDPMFWEVCSCLIDPILPREPTS